MAAEQALHRSNEAAKIAEHAAELATEKESTLTASLAEIDAAKVQATKNAIEAERKLNELRETLKNSITASLGGAFSQKADEGRGRDYFWFFVLCGALYALYSIGLTRYDKLEKLLDKSVPLEALVLHTVFSLAVIAGPFWLAWFTTKRLASTYAICEDYDYKASIAQAYQGYLDTSKNSDKLMEERLFSTVVTQLDASPVRFISKQHSATPLQDLMQQPFMKDLLEKNPSLLQEMKAWFKYKFGKAFEIPS